MASLSRPGIIADTVGVMALWPMMARAERSRVALGSSDTGCLLYRSVLMPPLEKVSLDHTGVKTLPTLRAAL